MNKDQNSKLRMYRTVDNTVNLPEHKPIWQGLVAYGRGVLALEGSINILVVLAQQQGADTTGITADKKRVRLSLENSVRIVAGALRVFAGQTNNETLKAQVTFTDSEITAAADQELLTIAGNVDDLATPLLANPANQLGDYGLTPAILDALDSAITAWGPLIGAPTAARAKKTSATQAMINEFNRADSILEDQLDPLMPQFEADHKPFVDAYWTARNIVQQGVRAEKQPTPPHPPPPPPPPTTATQTHPQQHTTPPPTRRHHPRHPRNRHQVTRTKSKATPARPIRAAVEISQSGLVR